MYCERCDGLMVQDRFEDFEDDTGRIAFTGWRCLLCGAILDPVIQAHHLARPDPVVPNSRRRWTRASCGASVTFTEAC